jgi:hypothetical protein
MEPSEVNKATVLTPDVVKAANGIDEEEKKRDFRGPYTSSRGVVLKYHKVPSQNLYKAWSKLEAPKVPEVWIEEHGRFEPNPGSPSYIESLGIYRHMRNNLTSYIYFMRGLEVFEIPPNMIPPESEDWYEGLEDVLEIATLKGKLARQTAWLMYYALDDEEQAEVLLDLMKLSGMIPEADVEDALDSFRGDEGELQADNTDKGTQGDSN